MVNPALSFASFGNPGRRSDPANAERSGKRQGGVNGTILIFVKAPVAGEVKTRLIPALGAQEAAALYRAMALDTLDTARRLSSVLVTVAYQARPGFPDPSWLAKDVPWFAQKGRNLGERLIHATQRVFDRTQAPVLVIGSDLPALTPSILENAFEGLHRASVVIGPAQDGGYYLIGLNRPRPSLFEGIAWSSPKVLKQTRRILARERLTAEYLPIESDLDTMEDLKAAEPVAGSLSDFPQTQSFLLRKRLAASGEPL